MRGAWQARTGARAHLRGRLTCAQGARPAGLTRAARDGQGTRRGRGRGGRARRRRPVRSRRQAQRGRPSRAGLGDRRRQTQMVQDPRDHRRIVDERDQLEAPPAPGAGEHVDAEAAPHQLGPVVIVRRWAIPGRRGLVLGYRRWDRRGASGPGWAVISGPVSTRGVEPDYEGPPCGARPEHAVIQDQIDPGGAASARPAAPADRAARIPDTWSRPPTGVSGSVGRDRRRSGRAAAPPEAAGTYRQSRSRRCGWPAGTHNPACRSKPQWRA